MDEMRYKESIFSILKYGMSINQSSNIVQVQTKYFVSQQSDSYL